MSEQKLSELPGVEIETVSGGYWSPKKEEEANKGGTIEGSYSTYAVVDGDPKELHDERVDLYSIKPDGSVLKITEEIRTGPGVFKVISTTKDKPELIGKKGEIKFFVEDPASHKVGPSIFFEPIPKKA